MTLINCPFCAGESIDLILVAPVGQEPKHAAACGDCGALGPITPSQAHAKAGWNMRMMSAEMLIDLFQKNTGHNPTDDIKKDLERIFGRIGEA